MRIKFLISESNAWACKPMHLHLFSHSEGEITDHGKEKILLNIQKRYCTKNNVPVLSPRNKVKWHRMFRTLLIINNGSAVRKQPATQTVWRGFSGPVLFIFCTSWRNFTSSTPSITSYGNTQHCANNTIKMFLALFLQTRSLLLRYYSLIMFLTNFSVRSYGRIIINFITQRKFLSGNMWGHLKITLTVKNGANCKN
jgi:hypothetical protein